MVAPNYYTMGKADMGIVRTQSNPEERRPPCISPVLYRQTVYQSCLPLPPGGTSPVHLTLGAPRMAESLRFELNAPPDGVRIQKVQPAPGGVTILLQVDATARPGLKGNLIVDAFLERPNQRRTPLGVLPAIPFEVISARR